MQGLLLISKPKDITSFGVVRKIKYLAKEKRVGHTGTLDPMATGVLPVLLGRATVLSNYLLCAEKTYIADVKLGITTDTLDITGNVLTENAPDVTNETLLSVLSQFTGRQKQTPPAFSAIKKDGVRAYTLAREGKAVELDSRDIEVFSLSLVKPLNENFRFSVSARVSKGTYIRSLVRDIGEALGCGAVLTGLVRTATAGFKLEDCTPLESLTGDNISDFVLPADKALPHLKNVFVTDAQAVRFSNGGELSLDRVNIKDKKDGEILKVYGKDTFLGLGRVNTEKNLLSVDCVINSVTNL